MEEPEWFVELCHHRERSAPSAYEGQILVPFAIESSLSGVGKKVGPDKEPGISVLSQYLLPGKVKK